MLLRITSVALLGLVLVGCDLPGTKLEKAQRVDPDGSTFNRNLYQGYIDLASSEYNEGDYTDSDNFAVPQCSVGWFEAMNALLGHWRYSQTSQGLS